MGRNGNVPVTPFKHYMATCRSICYTMGRNGKVPVSPFKHYVQHHAGPYVILYGQKWQRAGQSIQTLSMVTCRSIRYTMGRNGNMPAGQSIETLYGNMHAGPYVILWVEMATSQSLHSNIIWQHVGPYVILWVGMAKCQ